MSNAPAPGTARREQRVIVTTSWDDGHRLDPRLADLLDRYRIAGTFYIAPQNIELEPRDRLDRAALLDLAQRHEIGGHTLTHRRLPRLEDTDAFEEMRAGRKDLEQVLGSAVTSFCYPRGEYTATHVRLAEQAGFTLARTVRRGTLRPGPLLEADTTVNAYAHRVDVASSLRLGRFRPSVAARLYTDWDELALHWFRTCREQGGVFHLWGHSWEVDARGDWARLERVLAGIADCPDAVYVPNRDLVDLAA